jgi:hypothetical protein
MVSQNKSKGISMGKCRLAAGTTVAASALPPAFGVDITPLFWSAIFFSTSNEFSSWTAGRIGSENEVWYQVKREMKE